MKNNDIQDFLANWVKIYIKNKDVINKSIESKDFDLIVKYKDKEEFYIIEPFIKDSNIINKLSNDKIINLVVFNSEENLNFVLDNWKRFIDLKEFKIMFVNPFSELDEKWVIKPYMHHKICDESSLKSGLKSMFSMVTSIDENKIIEKLKTKKHIYK